ncbi:hypothetical protein [Iamia sp.]|uniref:hypothetical protein n=1 Tax=Iamia sp. TaxID=2722710 RepID=UPI002BB45CC0|nr:hypothetical protein [Iamia sp.]HXH58925.1 hypothetical protein [Iamia sp.]
MAKRRTLKVDGGVLAEMSVDDGAPTTVGSSLDVAVERGVRVRVGKALPVESDDPAVRRHYFELADRFAQDRIRQLRDQQPIRPIAKGLRAVAGRDGKVVCWRCGNRTDEVERCDTCDATGLVRPGGDPLDA